MWKTTKPYLFVAAMLSGLGGIASLLQFFGIRMGGETMTAPSNVGWLVAAVILFFFNLAGTIYFWNVWRKERARANASSALEFLKCQCAGILHEYEHLDHDHREETQYPLDPKSWPDFNTKPWSFPEAQLFKLNYQLQMTVQLSRQLWLRMGWETTHLQVFSLYKSIRMLDLIAALKELLAFNPSADLC